ncbi:MAG: class I SAM-dependent methyltransferase [Deltaproteobacteria bacterium]|nr:class I SAM-dependent methyltransferase [Deltaproteobacteria bacterium]
MLCRICDSTELELAIDLGLQPWCQNFLKKEEVGKECFYPLRLIFCHHCHTPQLDHTVPKETMFCGYDYLSGITRTLSDHFSSVASEVNKLFFQSKKEKAALDIGSNDGTQLKHYKALGFKVLGVEPSQKIAKLANEIGIETVNRFFNQETALELNRKFDVINAAGVFFHLEELHSATEGIRHLLKEDGIFVVQFLYMKNIVENGAFDQIYHEHLLYYNLENLGVLLHRHGLALFDAYFSSIHGGSIIAFVGHNGKRPVSERLEILQKAEHASGANKLDTYVQLGQRMTQMKAENIAYLKQKKKQGKRIYGFGAPAKGNTLLNYFGIGTQYIDFLVEKNKLRKGLYSPGSHIPIILEDEVTTQPDIYYVLAWNFKKEILANNKHLIQSGVEFYFPVNPKIS